MIEDEKIIELFFSVQSKAYGNWIYDKETAFQIHNCFTIWKNRIRKFFGCAPLGNYPLEILRFCSVRQRAGLVLHIIGQKQRLRRNRISRNFI